MPGPTLPESSRALRKRWVVKGSAACPGALSPAQASQSSASIPARPGRIVISTYPERAKTRNILRDDRVSVLVLSDDFNGPWVHVDGTCEVILARDEAGPFVEYFRNISGEHSDWDEYRAAMVSQDKALLRITPTRWSPVATGGFPPRLG